MEQKDEKATSADNAHGISYTNWDKSTTPTAGKGSLYQVPDSAEGPSSAATIAKCEGLAALGAKGWSESCGRWQMKRTR
jgi:hypothetical protein